MYMYLLLFTTCLNVETEVQCTAVPSTLTLWRETKWSNPLLIRRIAMTCWCNRNLQRKNVQIILKCNSPTFTIGTEYLSFYTLINTKFQQLPPPPYQEGTHRNLTVIHTGRGGGAFEPYLDGVGNFNWKCKSFHRNKHMVQNARYIYFRPESPLTQGSICWILNTYLDLIIWPSKCSYSARDNNYTLLTNCMYVSLNSSALNSTVNHTL